MNRACGNQEPVGHALLMAAPSCHAGACHDFGIDRGAAGVLCERCHAAYLRIIHRGPVSLLYGAQVGLHREAPAISLFRVITIDDEATP